MNLDQYDAVEVHPVTREVIGDREYFDQCEPDDPNRHCWSVYLHLTEGGIECIADCMSEAHARLVAAGLEKMLEKK